MLKKYGGILGNIITHYVNKKQIMNVALCCFRNQTPKKSNFYPLGSPGLTKSSTRSHITASFTSALFVDLPPLELPVCSLSTNSLQAFAAEHFVLIERRKEKDGD